MQVLVYRQAALAACTVLVGAQLAMAQPTLTIAPNAVAPGDAISATVTGPPGHYFAIVGSSVNAGATYGGLTLAVGTDYVLLAYGTLDGGRAIIGVRPPFHGSALDRYYLQAATSPSPMMLPAAVSPGVVVRNADLVTGLQGPTGPPGPMGPPGPPFPTNETGAFDLFNDHGIVAGGMHEPSGTDMVPLLVWYPKKAAFRVGSAGAADWVRAGTPRTPSARWTRMRCSSDFDPCQSTPGATPAKPVSATWARSPRISEPRSVLASTTHRSVCSISTV